MAAQVEFHVESVENTIRDNAPVFRHNNDKLTYVVHASFIRFGFQPNPQAEPWNEGDDYHFEYTHPRDQETPVSVTITVIGQHNSQLRVIGLKCNHSVDIKAMLDIHIPSFIDNVVDDPYHYHYLRDLLVALKEKVLKRFKPPMKFSNNRRRRIVRNPPAFEVGGGDHADADGGGGGGIVPFGNVYVRPPR